MAEALKRSLNICWTAVLLLLLLASPGNHPDASATENGKVILYYFWGTGCPVCEEAKPFLSDLARKHPQLDVRSYDVMASRESLALWIETAERFGSRPAGVPSFYIGERAFSGFSPEIAREIESTVRDRTAETVSGEKAVLRIPLFGAVDSEEISLPLFTILIAALDSFNPCAFFVLLFLLSLLIHVRSRRRMLLIGGAFVLCSGIVYFLFMAAWLNLFLLVGHLRAITTMAGVIALAIGIVNAKDFFFYKEGISLSIPESAKPKLFSRMRGLLKAESLATMLTGALVLAVAANSYELLCTAGFPMVFTRVLTLHSLPPGSYYLYLGLYNLVYIIPLAVIVGICSATLGRRKMSEWQGRVLKLLSGMMMILLGGVLLIEPALLNNPLWASGLLGSAILVTGIVAASMRKGWSRRG
jgi:thiol-disulfide isomerase/thioredoxin